MQKIDISVDSYQETAALYTYFLDNSPEMIPDRKRPLVLICPGGGYEMTSDREAEPVAIQYIAKGYQAAILRYSVKPAKYPLALLQLAKAVAHLREYANEYHIDTEKNSGTGIFRRRSSGMQPWVFLEETVSFETLGVSAEQIRPNGMILCYPVITSGEYAHRGSFEALLGEDAYDPEKRKEQSLELQVTKDTPPTFYGIQNRTTVFRWKIRCSSLKHYIK